MQIGDGCLRLTIAYVQVQQTQERINTRSFQLIGLVDDGLSFGKAINPRYTWASERWRGFDKIGETLKTLDLNH
jgi:hypothetical protein